MVRVGRLNGTGSGAFLHGAGDRQIGGTTGAGHRPAPVEGRWIAINSPADRVPSHGTCELGETYAIERLRGQRLEFLP
jgi:hypothetical protein